MEIRKSFQNQNVLVTGATGLLGSWLTDALVQQGANVTVLVRDVVANSNFYRKGLHKKCATVAGAIEDTFLLQRLIAEYEIESVVHLAAQTIVGVANNSPLSTFEANIKGTWNLLEACRLSKTVKRIVVSTSDKAYGEQPRLPYNEQMPLQGRHPYDVSKSCADLICQSYFHSYELPVCVIRCANFFGGGDLNFNRLVPGTIRSLFFNERPIIRSDGKFIRDYLYVQDGVNGILTILEKFTVLKLSGEVFNLGMGLQMDALHLVDKLSNIMGKRQLKPIILKKASNEIRQQYLSNKKALQVLKWKPQYAFDEALEETVRWYTDFFANN